MDASEVQFQGYNFLFYSIIIPIASIIGSLLFFRIYTWLTLGICDCTTSMTGKTVVITGANGGIGKETALELAKRGARVIMACRSLKRGECAANEIIKASGNEDVIVRQLDLCSFESVRNFANVILKSEKKIDVLINNAGVLGPSKRETTVDGCETVIQSNHLGHFLLTNLLLDLLKKSAPCRIINVASAIYVFSMINLDDLQYKHSFYFPWLVYSNSKLANILFTQELSRRLEGTGVTANSLHPGAVTTGFLSGICGLQALFSHFVMLFMKKNAREGAQTTIHLALSPDLENVSGKYFSECKKQRLYRSVATNKDYAKKLWTISEKIVGMRDE